MKVTKLILSMALCLTVLPSVVSATWSGAHSITALEVYPGDGTYSRRPVAVLNLSGTHYALECGNDNRGGDLLVQTLMQAYAANKPVKVWYETNPVTHYYQTMGTTWSSASTTHRITALSVLP